jgi:hypothetical protein
MFTMSFKSFALRGFSISEPIDCRVSCRPAVRDDDRACVVRASGEITSARRELLQAVPHPATEVMHNPAIRYLE